MPDMLFFVSSWYSKNYGTTSIKGHQVTRWFWLLTYDLKTSYFVRYTLVKCTIKIWLWFLTFPISHFDVTQDTGFRRCHQGHHPLQWEHQTRLWTHNNHYIWCQKQVSQAWISNCIPHYYVGCNYLSMPEIPASGTKVGCLMWAILGHELGPGGISPNQRSRWKHAFSLLKHV